MSFPSLSFLSSMQKLDVKEKVSGDWLPSSFRPPFFQKMKLVVDPLWAPVASEALGTFRSLRVFFTDS